MKRPIWRKCSLIVHQHEIACHLSKVSWRWILQPRWVLRLTLHEEERSHSSSPVPIKDWEQNKWLLFKSVRFVQTTGYKHKRHINSRPQQLIAVTRGPSHLFILSRGFGWDFCWRLADSLFRDSWGLVFTLIHIYSRESWECWNLKIGFPTNLQKNKTISEDRESICTVNTHIGMGRKLNLSFCECC